MRDPSGTVIGAVNMMMDITDRKRVEEAIRESRNAERANRQELETLMHAAPAGIWMSRDPQCRHIIGNATACAMLRMSSDENMSKTAPAAELPMGFDIYQNGKKVPPQDLPMQTAARTGQAATDQELEFRFQDGTSTWAYGNATPLMDENGTVRGAVGTFVDITQLKRAEEALREAKAETEAASKAKDDFLAALSHELRTPLNPAMLLASEWAQDASLPAEARNAFATIHRDIELEAHLIDDLLDLTRVARGKLRLEPEPTNVHDVLRASWELLQADAAEKRLTVQFDLAAPEPFVDADPLRLQQVFWNVIKNAVRFSPDGGSITIGTRPVKSGWVRIQVADDGSGIDPGDLERIFLPFDQGDEGHRIGGLGLGLTISRHLVELHGGRITAASDGHGRGAIFAIELPAIKKAVRTANPVPAQEASVAGVPLLRILLVEDHDQTRNTLASLLARRGHKVATAETAQQARSVALTFAYDLVLSDLGLPDGTGHELMIDLRRLRPDCRGIALSGYGMNSDILRSRAAGFDLHLTKPVDVKALDDALRIARNGARA
jgi:signal transduction histidine kinase